MICYFLVLHSSASVVGSGKRLQKCIIHSNIGMCFSEYGLKAKTPEQPFLFQVPSQFPQNLRIGERPGNKVEINHT